MGRSSSYVGESAKSAPLLAVLVLAGWMVLMGTSPWSHAQAALLAGSKDQASKARSELGAAGWRLLQVPGKAEADFTPAGPGGVAVEAERAVAEIAFEG